MRILLVSGFHVLGGSSTVIENIANQLTIKGIDVTIGALTFRHLPPLRNYNMRTLPIYNLSKLKNFLDSFDVIHSHHPLANYLAFVSSKPFVYHYHGAPLFGGGSIFRLSFLASIITTNSKFKEIITVSQTGYNELKKYLPAKDISRIYNGVDTNLFRLGLEQKYRKGRPQCLFVGNLYHYKRVDELIFAVKNLIDRYPKINLEIAGTGPAHAKLKKLVYDLSLENNVAFVGSVSNKDLPLYYASCDVYLTASENESCPLPLLEAWACGKPVLASSIPAHQELISLSKAGELYRAGDVGDLCTRLLAVYQNKDKYEENALLFAKEHDWKIVTDRVFAVYERALNS
jgi:glycosyltransferase involved in cell wall biosynthesis